MSAASDRHNSLVPILLADLIKGTDGEVEALVLLESLVVGVLSFYRPNPKQAVEFLDVMTAAVIERMRIVPR